MKNKLVAGALALSLFATPIVAVQAASTSDTSEALAECLYKHATASDKQVLVQWAYVHALEDLRRQADPDRFRRPR